LEDVFLFLLSASSKSVGVTRDIIQFGAGGGCGGFASAVGNYSQDAYVEPCLSFQLPIRRVTSASPRTTTMTRRPEAGDISRKSKLVTLCWKEESKAFPSVSLSNDKEEIA
jgi:hypothetical protein